MAYQPIEDYGLIGNMRTAALVGKHGSIDWCCFPYFDSPSVFGAILDDARGGRFQIAPVADDATQKQFYWPDTNVLVTRSLTADGIGEVIDFMPVGGDVPGWLVRRVRVVRGTLAFRMMCHPAFNYARDEHETQISECGAAFHAPDLSLGLATDVPLRREGSGVASEFTLQEGQSAVFVLRAIEAGLDCGQPLASDEAQASFERTVTYWHDWLSQCTYTGRWREIIYRSALVLKLLTFEPTGAIIAAPTASLPENLGGQRNWDYRYTWLRDAAFSLYALMRIGFTGEAAAFMDWLDARCHEQEPDAPLQPLYGVHGEHHIPETVLDHLEGYKGSRPVRIGNGADQQLQLDLYGEVLDSVYLYNKYGSFISYDLWQEVRRLLNWLCDNWQRTDAGIWEIRGEPQHFVYSKLMCWVALDRGLRLANKRAFPAEHEHWLRTRNAIYEEIMQRGWSDERQAFVQSYESQRLDAANLIMPLVFFSDRAIRGCDPRLRRSCSRGTWVA
jgi:GH15 family glucan-1,4-alpha-glucosidase